MFAERREFAIQYAPHRAAACAPARRVDDMHPQQAFHEDRYVVRYRGLYAGTGAGKTGAASFDVVALALENPGSVGLLFEPDIPMVKRTMIPALEQHLGPLDASPIVTFHKTDFKLTYPNESVQWLVGLKEGDKTEGINADYAWADEARLVRGWADRWRSIKRRLRGSDPATRGGIGAIVSTHSPTKEQQDEFEGIEARFPEYRVYRWSTLDNPILDEAYKNEILRSHTGPAREAVVEGRHARPEGLVYGDFNPTRHVRAAPSHHPRAYDRMTYGVDWGFSLPAVVEAIAWRGETAHVVEEFYGSHYQVEDLIDAARRMVATWGAGRFWCGADKPEHTRKFTTAGLQADPYVGKVADGVGILRDMMKGSELLIAPGCTELLRELDLYSLKPGADEPEKGDDHAPDALRYGIMGGRAPRRKLRSGT